MVQEQSINTGSRPVIIIEQASGDMRLMGWERPEVLAKAEDDVNVQQEGDTVRVRCQGDAFLRVPDLGLFQGSMLGRPTYTRHRIVAPAGRPIEKEDRPVLEAYLNRPHRASPATWLGLGCCFLLGSLLFCGYMRLIGGAASLLGMDVRKAAVKVRERVGYLPESDCLPLDVTAADFVSHMAEMSGLPTLADDSGLEVDALNGRPGVHSARYAPDSHTRIQKLLTEMNGVPDSQRQARFQCVIALAWPDGRLDITRGTCEGVIAHEARGGNGFGFDPVFYLPEHNATMAEMPENFKNTISHRARAAQLLKPILEQALQ